MSSKWQDILIRELLPYIAVEVIFSIVYMAKARETSVLHSSNLTNISLHVGSQDY